jgi:hypothetical protein
MAAIGTKQTIYVRHLEPDHILTVDVKLTKEFKLRFILAKFLLICAARILHCGIKVNDSEAS